MFRPPDHQHKLGEAKTILSFYKSIPVLGLAFGIAGGLTLVLTLSSRAEREASSDLSRLLQQAAQLQQKLELIESEVVKLQQESAAAPRGDAASLVEAEALASRGDIIGAIAILLPQIQKGRASSTQDEIRLFLGKLMVDARMDTEAISVLKPLIERTNPRDPAASMANYHLLRLHYRNKDYTNAVAAFKRIQGRLPATEQGQAMYLAGNSYLKIKDFLEAVKVLDPIPPASDLYPFALYSSGLAYLSIGDAFSSTRLQFQKLMDLDHKGDRTVGQLIEKTHVTLGFLFINQKRFQEALVEFVKVPPSSTYADQVRFGLGWAYIGMGDCVKAIVMFEDLVREYPASPYARESWRNIGACYSKLNAHGKAVESYRNALKVYSHHRQVLTTISEQIKIGNIVDLIHAAPRASARGVSGMPPSADPVKWIWRDLLAHGEVIALVDIYEDIRRFEQSIGGRAQAMGGAMADPALKERLRQVQVLRQEVEQLLRRILMELVEDYARQVNELALQANIGIAKGLSLVVENAAR